MLRFHDIEFPWALSFALTDGQGMIKLCGEKSRVIKFKPENVKVRISQEVEACVP
jgi:hypothetical protein